MTKVAAVVSREQPPILKKLSIMHVFVILVFLLGLIPKISSQMMTMSVPMMLREEDCAGCAEELISLESDISPEKLRHIKLEIIKQQILQKLRLKKPPNVTNPVLPELLVSGQVLQPTEEDENYDRFNKDDFYGTTQQVVIFPEKTNVHNCYSVGNDRRSSCLQVKLTHEVTSRGVSSADLWIYAFGNSIFDTEENAVSGDGGSSPVARNVTFTVIDVVPLHLSEGFRKRVVCIKKVKRSPGWINFSLTQTVRSWSQRRGTTHLLEIILDDVIGDAVSEPLISSVGNQKPFVVIDTDSAKGDTRRRRSVTCTDDSTHCCKEKFMVNFSEINWHRWIIFPYAYEANFCRGSCLADISSSRYHYTTILRRYIHQKSTPDNNNVTVTLCCTPYIMRPLTLLYIDEENNLFKTALPNMIVESCECA